MRLSEIKSKVYRVKLCEKLSTRGGGGGGLCNRQVNCEQSS